MSDKKEILMTVTAKYLSGAATPEETMALHESLADPKSKSEFDRLLKLWYHSSPDNIYQAASPDEGWIELEAMMQKNNKKHLRVFPVYKFMLAASIAAIILLSTWLYIGIDRSAVTIKQYHTASNIGNDTLPDGSVAVLNASSELSYPAAFKKNSRSVTFSGEAFFTITPDREKPFEITIDDLKIKVIGTSFNVREIKNERIEVQVVTGIVQMYKDDNSIIIKRGQTGAYDHVTKKLLLENKIDVNSYGYASRQFVFNNMAFSTACTYLEKAFNVTIQPEEGIFDDCRISSEFENQSLNYILEVLCSTLNATYTNKENIIYIKGKTKNKLCGSLPY